MREQLHIKCDFCGQTFTEDRESLQDVPLDVPIGKTFGYQDQRLVVFTSVQPKQGDICEKCAIIIAYDINGMVARKVFPPDEPTSTDKPKHPRTRNYWAVVAVVAIILLLILL